MRRRAFVAIATFAALVAAFVATSVSTAAPPGVLKAADLFAGQTTDVGDVYVWNDATNLYVQIDLASGWCMTESHVAAAGTVGEIPQNSQNNPTPGQFAYGDYYNPCEPGGDTFTIPLTGIGTSPVIAVHAKVWDQSSLAYAAAVSDTTTDRVYGPSTSYYAPVHVAWGASVPAVEPTFAGSGTWPTITGAQWISTATVTEVAGDSWRWHSTALNIPTGSWPVSGTVSQATSDNAERVWHNGTVIGFDGEVEGAFVDNYEWGTISTYPFTPVVGANTLDFVWRNYGVPGLGTTDNPNGLIYRACASYYTHSESAWAGTAVGQIQFNPSKSWATYFTYTLQDVLLETVTVPAALPNGPTGATSTTVLASGKSYVFKVTGTVIWTNRNGANDVDAECTAETPGVWAANAVGYPDDLLELQVNSGDVNWAPLGLSNPAGCANSHEYVLPFTGTGATVDFRIYDGVNNQQDIGWFGDNAGSLTVQIWLDL